MRSTNRTSPGTRARIALATAGAFACLCWGSAQAKSCLVPAAQVTQIRGVGEVEPLNARNAVLRPCGGTPSAAPVPVLFSVGNGLTKEIEVEPGASIARQVEQALRPGQALEDIMPRGSVISDWLAMLRGERVARSATKRFEGDAPMPLEGEVLAGRALRIRLPFHGWSPNDPIQVKVGGRVVDVRPVGGVATLPATLIDVGAITLTQRGRTGRLMGVAAGEFPGLPSSLVELDGARGVAPERIALRRAVLFSAQGLSLNALSEVE